MAELYREFDRMISEKDDSNSVLSFLFDHPDSIPDILKRSRFYTRIFCIDFFLKLSKHSIIAFFNFFLDEKNQRSIFIKSDYNIDIKHHLLILCRQMLKLKPYLDNKNGKCEISNVGHLITYVKNIVYSKIFTKFDSKRFFTGIKYAGIDEVDSMMIGYVINGRIAEFLNSLPNDRFDYYIRFCSKKSAFFNLIFQLDTFKSLSVMKKFIIVKNIRKIRHDSFYSTNILLTFVKQLINSDELAEIKAKVFFNYEHSLSLIPEGADRDVRDFERIFYKSRTFAEFILNKDIIGDQSGNLEDYVYMMLFNHKYEWLKAWEKYNKDELLNLVNCIDMVDFILKGSKNEKKH